MKEYNKTEREIVSTVLTASFYNNKSIVYTIKKGKDKKKYIRGLINYAYYESLKKGGILITSKKNGVALFTYPKRKQVFRIRTLVESIKVVFTAFGVRGIRKVLRRENYIKQFHPQQDFLYLWFIGVVPDKQGKSIGSSILKEIIIISEDQGIPVYLETSTIENLPFYKKHGFYVYNEWLDEQSGILLYFLRKD